MIRSIFREAKQPQPIEKIDRSGDVKWGEDGLYPQFLVGLSYETTGFSPKDMMYNEAQQYLATQIARAMNVPAYYISADMNNSMTYHFSKTYCTFIAIFLTNFFVCNFWLIKFEIDCWSNGKHIQFLKEWLCQVFTYCQEKDPLTPLRNTHCGGI